MREIVVADFRCLEAFETRHLPAVSVVKTCAPEICARRCRYPMFKDSGSKNHAQNGTRVLKYWILGPSGAILATHGSKEAVKTLVETRRFPSDSLAWGPFRRGLMKRLPGTSESSMSGREHPQLKILRYPNKNKVSTTITALQGGATKEASRFCWVRLHLLPQM